MLIYTLVSESEFIGENYYNNFERNLVRRLKELGKLDV